MKAKIAVIEEITDRPNVTEYLTKSSEYAVVGINNIIEFHNIAGHRPDIIVLDDTLAGGDSQQLCTMLKTDTRTSELPIILLTKADSSGNSGCTVDDTLVKPFEPEQLLAKIASLVAKPNLHVL